MLYAACFLRLLLAPYRAFLTRNRCLGETMLFCARRAPGLRPRRPRPACGRAGVPPSPRISARSLLPPIPPYSAAAFFAAAGPSAAPAGPPPALRPPQAPFQGALAAAFAARRFFAQNKPIAPGAAYSLSCFSSVLLLASGFFSFARSAVAVMPLASPKNTPAFMLPDMLPNTK